MPSSGPSIKGDYKKTAKYILSLMSQVNGSFKIFIQLTIQAIVKHILIIYFFNT